LPLATWRQEALETSIASVSGTSFFIAVLGAYFLGSIPTGFLMARWMQVDITRVGSGNIGATNVFRILGKGPGALVLFVDLAKGFVAVWALPILLIELTRVGSPWLSEGAAIGVVLGHNYTCWLRFKGGKGIATSAGALAALIPGPFLIVLITWLLVFGLSRYVSLASIAAALALPIATVLSLQGEMSLPLVGLTTVLSALAIWRHVPNIRRLIAGTENRVGAGHKAETVR
jgi:acyl phosphate:glycerol-3-phosphate acyltransferase